jgi:hypothetical protein
VVLHTPFGVVHDAVEHFDDGTDFHVEPRLLVHLSDDAALERLADVHGASRQAPLARQRLEAPLDEQHPRVAVHDHRAHAHEGAIGIGPAAHAAVLTVYSPITLTITRFRRRPSNSA